MHMLVRKGVLVLVLALALVSVTACDTADTTGPDSTGQPGSTTADQTSLPPGWSVGYFEDVDNGGAEAKIALDGGDYTPASPDGMGGGVLVGVFVNDDATLIVTTVSTITAP